MNKKAKGVLALIVAVAIAANVAIFTRMDYNKTHADPDHIVFRAATLSPKATPFTPPISGRRKSWSAAPMAGGTFGSTPTPRWAATDSFWKA